MEFLIARKMTTYLNYILRNQEKMMFKQNMLEQIYLPKDKSIYKNFNNSRPITKTSPIYKLLDTILNKRLQRALIDNN